MLVQRISFVNKLNFKGNEIKPEFKLPETEEDVFVKSSGYSPFSKETFGKAISTVIPSVLSDDPKESITLIVNDDTFGYNVGDRKSVKMTEEMEQIAKDPEQSVTAVHSHADSFKKGVANPVSVEDLGVLSSRPGLKRIYAVNSKGEYSMLEKTGDYIPSKETIESYASLIQDLIKQSLSPEGKEKLAQIEWNLTMDRNDENIKAFDDFIVSEDMALAEAKGVHKFWQQYAPELGVKYETNYTFD